jgi:hypothetical protein
MDEVVVLFIGPQREQSGRPAGFGGGALMVASHYGEGNGRRRGNIDSMEEPKVVTRRGRVTIGDEQRGGMPVGRRRLGAKAGGRRWWGWARWAASFSWAEKVARPECR